MRGVVAVLLAGGQARRMGGGDKCLRPLGGRPMLAQVIERASPQVDAMMLNANGDPARFANYGLPVVNDVVGGFAGPLAGILTGMRWAEEAHPDAEWLVSIATDTPFFPTDLVEKMLADAEKANVQIACAASGGRTHPVFGLWSTSLADDLAHAMEREDIRKIDLWTERYSPAVTDFTDSTFDPFFNANREDDLAEAERWLAASAS